MADNLTIAVVIAGKDDLSQPIQKGASALRGLQQSVAGTSSALGGLGNTFRSVASTAAGFAAGMLGLQAIGSIGNAIHGVVSGMIGYNAQAESMRQSFKVLMTDAAAESKQLISDQGTVASATSSAGASVRDAQERMADAAEDHRLAIEKLSAEFGNLERDASKRLAELAGELDDTLRNLDTGHARTMDDMRRQLNQYSQEFARQSNERRQKFDDEMANQSQRYADEVAAIQGKYADLAETAPERFLREQEEAKRTSETLKAAIDAEQAKGSAADRALLASLQRRLTQEQVLQKQSFTQFQDRERQKLAEEEATARKKYDTAVAAVQRQFAAEEAAAHASYARQVEDLQRRMAQEEQQYAEQVSKRKAQYDKDLANYKESEAEKVAALMERQESEERSYARMVRDAQQALEKAGASYAASFQQVTRAQTGGVNQLKQMYADLSAAVGRELGTAEERADAMMEWITKKAKETPFNIPQVTEMANQLMAFQINAVDWFDTIGNVAAGMHKPLSQVVQAFGYLASGATGQAAESLRQIGINLRNIFSPKEMNAEGMILIPIEQALDKVKQAMDVRFKGMMAEQMTTLEGIWSNIGDMWIRFEKTIGKPIFEQIKGGLSDLLSYMDENEDKLMEWGATVGDVLSKGIAEIGPKVKEIMTGFFDWIASGKAKTDTEELIDGVQGVGKFFGDAIQWGRDTVGWLRDMGTWIDQNRVWLGLLLGALGLIAAFLGGPLLVAFGLVVTGWALLKGPIIEGIKKIGEWFDWLGERIGDMWSGVVKSVQGAWSAAVSTVAGAINAMISMFNTLLKAWNAISFKVPDWVPGIGGRVFDAPQINLLPTIDQRTVDGILRLLLGAAVPVAGGVMLSQGLGVPVMDNGGVATQPMLAALAINGRPEAVIPLDSTLIDYDRLAAAIARQPITVTLDGEKVGHATRRANLRTGVRNGYPTGTIGA